MSSSADPPVPRLVSCFQPIVDLSGGSVVGFEALTRAADAPHAGFGPLLDYAERTGRWAELDWACRVSAFAGALSARLGQTLFINAEPTTFQRLPFDSASRAVLARATEELNVIVEVTERALLRHPANVLRLAQWARSLGWGVAVDDVGAYPESLAVLPFLAPDVIKLDMALVHGRPGPTQSRSISGVMAQVERSRALLLAEGIETADHLEQALSFGAELGQGLLFGDAAPLPELVSV